ncbi:MAG: hypothetical protein MJB14_14865 [Spirochaetes bacterium]|nr:hypothetical protein [Spirochaetota bacterium]
MIKLWADQHSQVNHFFMIHGKGPQKKLSEVLSQIYFHEDSLNLSSRGEKSLISQLEEDKK